MIDFVSGIVDRVAEDHAVIDVGGIGFDVAISGDTASRMPSAGQQVRLYTYFSVSQDVFRLYGFLSREDLEIFKKLITVSGLGPKGGQAILSVLSPDELKFAILTGDTKSITAAPGIGKKIAERIILELKDRFSDEELTSGVGAGTDAVREALADDDPGREAIEALTALGYGAQEAMRAVRKVLAADGAVDTEAILKAALKELM
ncbi:MAG: Holliday junction branch migration protein RuvA [Lachnospiraceae bacterium]|nr:Holliday junction branch migration protein RuvA [Lachnospiraceae bacterium]